MKIKSIINKNIPKLYAEDSIEKAIKLLVSIPQSALPVLDKQGKVIGELSQRDLLLLDIGTEEFRDDKLSFKQVKFLLAKTAKKVKDLMMKHQLTLSPDDDVLDAAKLIYDNNISTIPIVDSKDKLLGIITDICILKHYKKILNAKRR